MRKVIVLLALISIVLVASRPGHATWQHNQCCSIGVGCTKLCEMVTETGPWSQIKDPIPYSRCKSYPNEPTALGRDCAELLKIKCGTLVFYDNGLDCEYDQNSVATGDFKQPACDNDSDGCGIIV